MKKRTLKKIQYDFKYSEIQRMAAGELIASKKKNGARNLPWAAKLLQQHYPDMPFEEALEYCEIVAKTADEMEV